MNDKPETIDAPWHPDQVAALNDFHALDHVHPFTCANGCGVLIAHTDGWLCPCGYRLPLPVLRRSSGADCGRGRVCLQPLGPGCH